LDFGAIGKGLVVDKISEKLLQMGIDQFNINASGNMRMCKAPDNTQGWPVSIDLPVADPNQESLEFMRMRLSHRGVATSGDRWQKFPDPIEPKIGATDSKKSSHIVDPKTLRGISEHHSVTVIADNAMDADAIATATSVRTQNDLAGWLQTLNRLKPGVQVLILCKDEESQAIRSRFVGG
jgi:thiamine biosynthesis lipoprotein